MSRSGRSQRNRRDTNNISSGTLPSFSDPFTALLSTVYHPTIPLKRSEWRLYDDKRRFTPSGMVSPAISPFQRRIPYTLIPKSPSRRSIQRGNRLGYDPQTAFKTMSTIAFSKPNATIVCMRRAERKQVLHAFNKTGKTGQRAPRLNYMSKISCRSI